MSINEKLGAYESAWDSHVDSWLVVKVGSPDWVYSWRLQAEVAMRASGRPGMTDEQVMRLLMYGSRCRVREFNPEVY